MKLGGRLWALTGPDSVSWLHGVCTQDIAGMAVGEERQSFLLEPNGRVVDHLAIRCTSDGLEIAASGDGLSQAVDRFVVMEDLTLAPASEALFGGAAGIQLAPRCGVSGDGPHDQGFRRRLAESGLAWIDGISLGRFVPADFGPALFAATISMTKGCYVGQEIVHRMHARSVAPKTLALIRGEELKEGLALTKAGRKCGEAIQVFPGVAEGLAVMDASLLAEESAELDGFLAVRLPGFIGPPAGD